MSWARNALLIAAMVACATQLPVRPARAGGEAGFSLRSHVLEMTADSASPLEQCAAAELARILEERLGPGTEAWHRARKRLQARTQKPRAEEIADAVLQEHRDLLLDRGVTGRLVRQCAEPRSSAAAL